jgi:hypothetical protein
MVAIQPRHNRDAAGLYPAQLGRDFIKTGRAGAIGCLLPTFWIPANMQPFSASGHAVRPLDSWVVGNPEYIVQ